MVLALETHVTRAFDIFDPVVVTVGTFHAGTVDNVIPATAMFDATVRSFSHESRAQLSTSLVQVVEGVAAAHGLDVDVLYEWGYPVTVNDNDEALFAAGVVASVFGEDRFAWLDNPGAGSEDFAYVLEKVPGAYLNLGACPAGHDPATAPNNHSPYAQFDDTVVPDGAVLLASLAQARLEMAQSRV